MPEADQPFDDIRNLVASMPEANKDAYVSIVDTANTLGRDLSPLGCLEEAIAWLGSWHGTVRPVISRPLVAVFAGTHGVGRQVFDGNIVETSKTRIKSLTEGKSAVRGIAANAGSAFKVYEFGLEYPSEDFTKTASLTEKDCAAAVAFGMEVVAEGADIIVLGNAGLGAATAAAGIARGLFGGGAEYWAGGIGQDAEQRISAVKAGAQLHKDNLSDPLEVLRCFGGRDIAGIVGAILAARHQNIPVIIDGYVVCAAAAVLREVSPTSLDHCIAAHVSQEPAHRALLDRLGLKPLLDLNLNIGDGTGGAIAMGVLKAAAAGLNSLQDEVI